MSLDRTPPRPASGGDTPQGSPLDERRRRHERAKAILCEALELEATLRPAYVTESCGGDVSLEEEVLSLLGFEGDEIPPLAPAAAAGPVTVLEKLLPGSLFAGRYRIERLVGEGGSGQVYRAHDTLLGVTVAVKRVRVDGPVHRRRLLEEARLARQVTHPAACRIHDAGVAEGETFLTMEYLDGVPLARLLETEGALPAARVRELGRALCDGLGAAHAAGVLHGDLKPANVMMLPGGRPCLVDFDLARTTGASRDGSFLAGTPAYMAPEQLDVRAVIDERTDLHALGLILHEAWTGAPAFDASTPATMAEQVRRADPAPARAGVAAADPDLDRLLVDLLQKDPSLRPASAAQVAAALAGVQPPATPRRGRVPRPLTRLIGREKDVASIAALVTERPLVTLVGAPGCGKTRLAVEIARATPAAFGGGAWFVDLTEAEDGSRVPSVVAHAVVGHDAGGRPSAEGIAAVLREGRALLVLDNCEHVAEAAARLVTDLLDRAADLHVLATSREPLGVHGEALRPVGPLPVPAEATSPGAPAAFAAVEMFVDRAADAHPGFVYDATTAPAVGRICRRLDGIPLALELAAMRLRTVTLDDLAQRIDELVLDLGGAEPPSRPHEATLRLVLERSVARLDATEAILLRRLSVFRGGFTLERAEVACSAAPLEQGAVARGLASLADRSLVHVERVGGRLRHRLLEPVREVAARSLAASGEEDAVREAHLKTMLALATAAERPLQGPESGAWSERLSPELPNLRVALAFGATSPARARSALRLAAAAWPYLEGQIPAPERLATVEALLAAAGPGAHPAVSGWGHALAGLSAARQGALDGARSHLLRSFELGREAGDEALVAHACWGLAQVAAEQGDAEAADRHLVEGLAAARAAGSDVGEVRCLLGRGNVALRTGGVEPALEHYREALACARRRGLARLQVTALANVGVALRVARRWSEATDALQESLRLGARVEPGAKWLPALVSLGACRLSDDDAAGACEILREAVASARALGDVAALIASACNLASALSSLGEHDEAEAALRAVLPDALAFGAPQSLGFMALVAASILLSERHVEGVILLLGAVDADCARRGVPRPTIPARDGPSLDESLLAEAGNRETFERLKARGGAMSLAAALEHVLAR